MTIAENLNTIKRRISAVTDLEVTIVAATKTRTVDQIKQAVSAGITDVGESRLQEFLDKAEEIPEGITKHFIGRLQSNKVFEVASNFDVIQSVDSVRLARRINDSAEHIGKTIAVLIQVNTSGEDQKGGVDPNNLETILKETSLLSNIEVQGLMTLAVRSKNEDEVRACFIKLRKLRDNLLVNYPNLKTLSMGMSDDYEIAAQEGSTMVRIGRGLFLV